MGNLLDRATLAYTAREDERKRQDAKAAEHSESLARLAMLRFLGYGLRQADSIRPIKTTTFGRNVHCDFLIDGVLFTVSIQHATNSNDPITKIEAHLWRNTGNGWYAYTRFEVKDLADLGSRIKYYKRLEPEFTFIVPKTQLAYMQPAS